MRSNFRIILIMKFLRYILAISLLSIVGVQRSYACGPYYPDKPGYIKMFRVSSPELEQEWQEGCRFQDYANDENCMLWQKITSRKIPLHDIETVVYKSRLSDLRDLSHGKLSDNKFAQWLSKPEHREDLDYLLTAKEIEEIREYMNDPWYYAYDGDEEHKRLDELMTRCEEYKGKRHAARYALQIARLYFARKDYNSCLKLWESSVSSMPQDIVTDMIASYVGGAYLRRGNRNKAVELYTRSQDIGSLISMNAWNDTDFKSEFTDKRVKELDYIFSRFPNSPLLSIRLQDYVRAREGFAYDYADWKGRNFQDPVPDRFYTFNGTGAVNCEQKFYDELKRFAQKAVKSPKCYQKGMWRYALGYLSYLDGNIGQASAYLKQAEHSEATPFINESIQAFRFLIDAIQANNSNSYSKKLLRELKWLDERMAENVNPDSATGWQYANKMNWPTFYWQNVARKVLLGEVCPKMLKSGNPALALQLANYASNRIYQLSPMYSAYHYGYDDPVDKESYSVVLPFDEYRKTWSGTNYFDYSNQFFEVINGIRANDAAVYADRIAHPKTDLDKFLNQRSYVDTDYIYEIVGTLYLREMNYPKASAWLSKVSADYQKRTNLAKAGYFKLDPFRYQSDRKQFINDNRNYKLRFANEMARLEGVMRANGNPDGKAEAKIRYAIGLRNSFGRCWYLTDYSYNFGYGPDEDPDTWRMYTSSDRGGSRENAYAQKAYRRVDALMKEAVREFADPEKAARAQLEMKNYATLMQKYPRTRAATQIRGRCDNYRDYALQKR